MTVENPTVVDGMGFDPAAGKVTLLISDHLDWADEKAHISALQRKLNSYLDFVQSGQVWESYPERRDVGVVVKVVAKYLAPPSVGWFLGRAAEAAEKNGVEFWYGELPGKFEGADSRPHA